MRENVFEFVKILSEGYYKGPVVEYGSKETNVEDFDHNNLKVRDLFSKTRYIGCDVQEGDGVDLLDNLLHSTFLTNEVGTVLLLDTLEHIENPWKAIAEVYRILSSIAGIFCVTVPAGKFPIHHLPDYWRFTPQGLDLLLKRWRYRLVFFQGEYQVPHTIFGVAFSDPRMCAETQLHLFDNLGRVPGTEVGEEMHLWEGQWNYRSECYNRRRTESKA
jgi:SAM-dependent methyltransferase